MKIFNYVWLVLEFMDYELYMNYSELSITPKELKVTVSYHKICLSQPPVLPWKKRVVRVICSDSSKSEKLDTGIHGASEQTTAT